MATMKNTTMNELKMIKESHIKTNSIWQVYMQSAEGFVTGSVLLKNGPKRPILVFNSASQCGFTHQLSKFEELYQTGKITPIAIPTNEFGQQEPGTDEQICELYKENYGVTFPVLLKTDLKHPSSKCLAHLHGTLTNGYLTENTIL